VDGAGLYFYASEPHQRPHVEVRGAGWRAKIALDTLEVLATAGNLSHPTLRAVLELLAREQQRTIWAFHKTAAHRFPGTLGQQQEDDGE